ncbi:MAG: DNA-3-methyladenine glycosylase I [Wenzhouxiangellaceae bacterium]
MANASQDEARGRCPWCGDDPLYVRYHDHVWGRPERDSLALFEKLCLDGQQAGLSWITILRKQDSYRAAYAGFQPDKIARFDDRDVARLLADPGVIRNRLKVHSIIRNARAWLALTERGVDFSEFLWTFVDGNPVQNRWRTMDEVPVTTPVAEAMSKALKKAGFNFVGPTIVYAFMQAVGMVNDHLTGCPRHAEVKALG